MRHTVAVVVTTSTQEREQEREPHGARVRFDGGRARGGVTTDNFRLLTQRLTWIQLGWRLMSLMGHESHSTRTHA